MALTLTRRPPPAGTGVALSTASQWSPPDLEADIEEGSTRGDRSKEP